LFFLTFGLPLLLFNAVLMVDISRLITSNRYVASVADATALAGAQQFEGLPAGCEPGEPGDCQSYSTTLDPSRSVDMMQYMVGQAEPARASRDGAFVLDNPTRSVQVWTGRPTASGVYEVDTLSSKGTPSKVQRATAVVSYQAPGLVFLPALERMIGGQGVDPGTVTVVRSADVCVPDQYAPTGGFCTRPDPR